jgi:hypothetical protein
LEISDDKVLELFYTVGEVSSKVDIVFNQLIGEDGKGEITALRERLTVLESQVGEIITVRRLTGNRRMSKKTRAILYSGLAVGGKLLFEAGKILAEYIKQNGGK